MCEQVFLVAVDLVGLAELPRVDIHPVLPLLREGYTERHNVSGYLGDSTSTSVSSKSLHIQFV